MNNRQSVTGNPVGIPIMVIGGIAMFIALVLFIMVGHPALHAIAVLGVGGFFVLLLGGIIAS